MPGLLRKPRKNPPEIEMPRKSQEAPVNEKSLREHLVNVLSGHGAHIDWKATFAGVPPKMRGARPHGLPYSLWELLEHMRIAQSDILEFSRDAEHVSPEWPAGYWPATQAPPNTQAWDKSLKSFEKDLAAMKKLVNSPKTHLFAKIPHGTGQTVLREAILVADHNSYHLGQALAVRRILGIWK
jgi:hypothetical protein